MLLVGALGTSVFFGWIVPNALKLESIGTQEGALYNVWLVLIRFVIPPVLFYTLIDGLGVI